jgi:hypothetical protein
MRRVQVVHSADSTGARIRQKSVGRSEDPGRRQFKVRSLSAAETDRLETVCSRQRELWGQATYQSCLKAQLDMMTNPAGKPDLSALHEAERESIESVCSEARGMGSPERYNRCVTEQKARLRLNLRDQTSRRSMMWIGTRSNRLVAMRRIGKVRLLTIAV